MGKSQTEGFVERVVAVLMAERLRQGLAREKLADAAGVHRTTVSRTERGLMSPTLYVLHAMACALGLQFSDVVLKAEGAAARKSA
jgi:transcriptional regulator with XRE-family HTH domain